MAIILPHGLNIPEIRVLQEFRRLNADTLPMETIKAIKHPVGASEPAVASLVAKGHLQAGEAADTFALTQKAKDFLAIDAKPEVEETSDAAASAAANAGADGV